MKAGKELDTKVAEFIGWDGCHVIHYCEDTWYNYCRNDGCYESGASDDNIMMWDGGDPPIPGCKGYPPYSTDISAAMPVLEKAKKNFFSTTITMWDHTDKVVIVGDKRQGHNENISVLTVQAETLPLAICKFALRTKENENE